MKKIGVLGAGQLARMMALAGYPLGIKIFTYEPSENPCASEITNFTQADFTDLNGLDNFAKQVDVITFESENIAHEALQYLSKSYCVRPCFLSLEISSDRLKEKNYVRELGFHTADFYRVDSLLDLENAAKTLGFPCVLKTTRFGYDGKGQCVIKNNEDITKAWQMLNEQTPLILEGFVHFQREISMIAVRNGLGETAFYPLTHNQHRDGILRVSMPFINANLQNQAEAIAKILLEKLNYVGVLTIEFFETSQGLLINELAPRVHNSGHWTIEGAHTSQFENHLRAISDLPLGLTGLKTLVAMVNIISELPDITRVLAIPGTHFHDYGKPARKDRKLGHVTVTANNPLELQERLDQLISLIH